MRIYLVGYCCLAFSTLLCSFGIQVDSFSPLPNYGYAAKRRNVKHQPIVLYSSIANNLCKIVADELPKLKSGSDIRGEYCSDEDSLQDVASQTRKNALITPTISYCLGLSFAKMVQARYGNSKNQVSICVGRDPRVHGQILSRSFCMGALAAGAKLFDTGLATTPSMFEFCRSNLPCDGGVMVTASHLPVDRNGMKFFTKEGGFSSNDIKCLIEGALDELIHHNFNNHDNFFFMGDIDHIQPVNYMPYYANTLKDALLKEVSQGVDSASTGDLNLPLAGLRIILNAGGGSGYFFNEVLRELGADVSSSMGIEPDSEFPNGVPNPEDKEMVKQTISRCEEVNADIGIMLDTDADRCGFVIPGTTDQSQGICQNYEPLNRNRLIALLSVIFSSSSPGCSIVTDSVTSEGLTTFLEENLGLKHVRYLKGYANVINKAKELTSAGKENAEMAIETSGHCAMHENGYLDDGTYTAVKVIGLLARMKRSQHLTGLSSSKLTLLDLIKDLKEMDIVDELRMNVKDGSIASTTTLFDLICDELTNLSNLNELSWEIDRDNLEGIRIRTILTDGGFFMLRKSLHDPIISLQIEAANVEQCRSEIIAPLREVLSRMEAMKGLDISVLNKFET